MQKITSAGPAPDSEDRENIVEHARHLADTFPETSTFMTGPQFSRADRQRGFLLDKRRNIIFDQADRNMVIRSLPGKIDDVTGARI